MLYVKNPCFRKYIFSMTFPLFEVCIYWDLTCLHQALVNAWVSDKMSLSFSLYLVLSLWPRQTFSYATAILEMSALSQLTFEPFLEATGKADSLWNNYTDMEFQGCLFLLLASHSTNSTDFFQSLRQREIHRNFISQRASLIVQLVKNLSTMRETWIWSLGWEDPLEKGKATHSSVLAWRIPWTV